MVVQMLFRSEKGKKDVKSPFTSGATLRPFPLRIVPHTYATVLPTWLCCCITLQYFDNKLRWFPTCAIRSTKHALTIVVTHSTDELLSSEGHTLHNAYRLLGTR